MREILKTHLVWAATSFGIAIALIFNVGFFRATSLSYMGLFTIQEHIVFATSGAVTVSIIIAFTVAAGFIPYNLIKNRTMRIAFIVVFFSTSFVTLALSEYVNEYYNFDTRDSFGYALTVLLFGWLVILLIRNYNRGVISYLSILLIMLISAFSGRLYGSYLRFSDYNKIHNWALLRDGSRYGVVRLGSNYAILTDDKSNIRVVPTSSLYTIGTASPLAED